MSCFFFNFLNVPNYVSGDNLAVDSSILVSNEVSFEMKEDFMDKTPLVCE